MVAAYYLKRHGSRWAGPTFRLGLAALFVWIIAIGFGRRVNTARFALGTALRCPKGIRIVLSDDFEGQPVDLMVRAPALRDMGLHTPAGWTSRADETGIWLIKRFSVTPKGTLILDDLGLKEPDLDTAREFELRWKDNGSDRTTRFTLETPTRPCE
jgi:hypothetical protein